MNGERKKGDTEEGNKEDFVMGSITRFRKMVSNTPPDDRPGKHEVFREPGSNKKVTGHVDEAGRMHFTIEEGRPDEGPLKFDNND